MRFGRTVLNHTNERVFELVAYVNLNTNQTPEQTKVSSISDYNSLYIRRRCSKKKSNRLCMRLIFLYLFFSLFLFEYH